MSSPASQQHPAPTYVHQLEVAEAESLKLYQDTLAEQAKANEMLKQVLYKYNLTITPESMQEWNGNCWFEALAQALLPSHPTITALQIRQQTVDSLRRH